MMMAEQSKEQYEKEAQEFVKSRKDVKHLNPYERRLLIDGYIAGKLRTLTDEELFEEEVREYFSNRFGADLPSRVSKLQEEVQELKEEVSNIPVIEEALVDELSDASAVLFHITTLTGRSWKSLVKQALDKAKKRETDPDYKRRHPHVTSKKKLLSLLCRTTVWLIPGISITTVPDNFVFGVLYCSVAAAIFLWLIETIKKKNL